MSMKVLWIGVFGGLAGCAGGDPTTPTDTDDPYAGACGDILEADMEISGRVEDASGAPVAGADVWVEERNWAPGTIHGQGTTGADGTFAFSILDLPIVEGCWGTAVQFYLAGESAGLQGDKPVNPPIIGAWNDGSMQVELADFPLVLEEATTP
jgi:hypothetical protein